MDYFARLCPLWALEYCLSGQLASCALVRCFVVLGRWWWLIYQKGTEPNQCALYAYARWFCSPVPVKYLLIPGIPPGSLRPLPEGTKTPLVSRMTTTATLVGSYSSATTIPAQESSGIATLVWKMPSLRTNPAG